MKKDVYLSFNSRHIGQVGRELVTDYVTAIFELVKNSYDADAELVKVSFTDIKKENSRIVFIDTGEGFTEESIISNWSVIGTNSKVNNRFSKVYKRHVTGKKGIGRFAVERLAEKMTLYSLNNEGKPIKYFVNWNKFEGMDIHEINRNITNLTQKLDVTSAKYIRICIDFLLNNPKVDAIDKVFLDSFVNASNSDARDFYNVLKNSEIKDELHNIFIKYKDIESKVDEISTELFELVDEEFNEVENQIKSIYDEFNISKDHISGTILILEGLRDDWKEKDINKLSNEMMQLINPLRNDENFSIILSASEFNISEKRLTNKILDLNYAKISAIFDNTSNVLKYTLSIKDDEVITNSINMSEYGLQNPICGDFDFDIYYFVRDTTLSNKELNVAKARNILDIFYGVKMYRDNFRVKPYGDEGNDWLLLDKRKITETHGYLASNNQLIGCINISSEDNPLLVDSTNREAIIENTAFVEIRLIVTTAIEQIQAYRYSLYLNEIENKKIEKLENLRNKSNSKIISDVEKMKARMIDDINREDVKNLTTHIDSFVEKVMIDAKKTEKYNEDIKNEYVSQMEKTRNEVNLYKNLASLGIFSGSFAHETDDTTARLLGNVKYISIALDNILSENSDVRDAVISISDDGNRISKYSDLLISFLKKKNREGRTIINYSKVIKELISKYEFLIEGYDIKIDTQKLTNYNSTIKFYRIDFESIIINLLTNSFEELKKISENRKISISVERLESSSRVIFEDSGNGIPLSKREWVFLPLRTTKEEDGIGLGLTIIKDLVQSYNGDVTIVDSELGGAKFVINIPEDVGDE